LSKGVSNAYKNRKRKTMKQISNTIILFILAILTSACMTDPAVKLANCIEESTKILSHSGQQQITASCNVHQQGGYMVVLYPAKDITDDELSEFGLNNKTIKALRNLQLPGEPYESIFFIPFDGQDLPSRTTYQSRFIKIPNLICKTKKSGELTFTLSSKPFGIEIIRIE
jgi:entry exclusion lipoprotein TrbK